MKGTKIVEMEDVKSGTLKVDLPGQVLAQSGPVPTWCLLCLGSASENGRSPDTFRAIVGHGTIVNQRLSAGQSQEV